MSDTPETPGKAYRVAVVLLLAVMAVSLAAIALKVAGPKPDPNAFYSK